MHLVLYIRIILSNFLSYMKCIYIYIYIYIYIDDDDDDEDEMRQVLTVHEQL